MSARMNVNHQQPMPFPQAHQQIQQPVQQPVAQPVAQPVQQPVQQVEFNDVAQQKKPTFQSSTFDMESIGRSLTNLIKDLTGKTITFTDSKVKNGVTCNATIASIRKEFLEDYAKLIKYLSEDPKRTESGVVNGAFLGSGYAELIGALYSDIDISVKDFNDAVIAHIKKNLSNIGCLREQELDVNEIRNKTLDKMFIKYFNNKYHKSTSHKAVKDLTDKEKVENGKNLSKMLRLFNQELIDFYNLPFDQVIGLDGKLDLNKPAIDTIVTLANNVVTGAIKDIDIVRNTLFDLFKDRKINIDTKVKNLKIFKWMKMHLNPEYQVAINEYGAFVNDYTRVLNECVSLLSQPLENVVTALRTNEIYKDKKNMDIAFSILKSKYRFHTNVVITNGDTKYKISDKYKHFIPTSEKRYHVIMEEPLECAMKCFNETLTIAGDGTNSIQTTIARLIAVGKAVLKNATFDNTFYLVIGTYLFILIVNLVREYKQKVVCLEEGIKKKK